MKPAFENKYPKIEPKKNLQGEVLLIQDIRKDVKTPFGEATIYEAIRESDGTTVAFTGGTVLDKQELERNDKITLRKVRGKQSDYWIAESA